jgi:hypothetical protein
VSNIGCSEGTNANTVSCGKKKKGLHGIESGKTPKYAKSPFLFLAEPRRLVKLVGPWVIEF